MKFNTLLSAVCATAICACSGRITSDRGVHSDSGGTDGTEGKREAEACRATQPSVDGRLRRLTRVELENTFVDLFGETGVNTHRTLDLEPQSGVFYNGLENLWADGPFLQKYLPLAQKVAGGAAAQIEKLHPCAWGGPEAKACAQGFVRGFGQRLFRKPVPEAVVGKYAALFAAQPTQAALTERVGTMLQAMLLSTDFLYRDETLIGNQQKTGAPAVEAQYQLATQLSYLLWASTPDQDLLAAAADGALATRKQVELQVERMLSSPRAHVGMVQFFEQLFDHPKYGEMDKDAKEHPQFSAELIEDMKAELRAFIRSVAFAGDGTVADLFTAPYSFASPRLAAVYGIGAGADSTAKTQLPHGQRAGLLTQAGFLAYTSPRSGTTPVKRGAFILERLLCVDLPPIPDQTNFEIPDNEASREMTTRQRFELHVVRPECRSCHQMLDPIGFGLENYDGLGRYRTHDNGKPVDAQGELTGTDDQDGPFSGGVELATRLANSQRLHACIARQYFRYAMGRSEVEADACRLAALEKSFAQSGSKLKTLVRLTATSELFLQRSARP